MWLAHVAETVASCTGEPLAMLAERTTRNAGALFALAPLGSTAAGA
jgi:hypothetical protein